MRQGQRDKVLDFSRNFPVVLRPEPEPLIDLEQQAWEAATLEAAENVPTLPMLPMSSTDSWHATPGP